MTAPTRAPLIFTGGDRFPADVRELDADDPGGFASLRRWREARVVLTCAEPAAGTEPRLLVYVHRAGPALDVVWYPDRSILGRRTVDWRIETVAGTFVVSSSRSCGCGSKVSEKVWDPFTPMRMQIGAGSTKRRTR